jgi:hypothetical protein
VSLLDCDNNLSKIKAGIQVMQASTVVSDIKLANGDDKLIKISAKIHYSRKNNDSEINTNQDNTSNLRINENDSKLNDNSKENDGTEEKDNIFANERRKQRDSG